MHTLIPLNGRSTFMSFFTFLVSIPSKKRRAWSPWMTLTRMVHPKPWWCSFRPEKSSEEIIPGLDWLSYLFYAAKFHHVDWGFLTNGLEMRVFDFRRDDYRKIFLWANLDRIIRDGKLDSFFTIYKIFSYMRGRKVAVLPPRGGRKSPKTQKPVSPEYDLAYHTNNIQQSTINLFETLRGRILALSTSITEKYGKLYIGYSIRKNFCEICIQKNQLKVWIDLSIDELSDPHFLCRDVRKIGHHGIGASEITLQNIDDVDAVFEIVKQAYNTKI